MNENQLVQVKQTFKCPQKENFDAKFSLVTRKGCVLEYMPITKDKRIESLCNFKVCFTKVMLIFHGYIG